MKTIHQILSKSKLFKRAKREISRDALGHAVLITGDKSAAEALGALLSAAVLCKEGGCFDCGICDRVLKGIHPDALSYPRSEKISVAEIELLISDAQIRPLEGAKKVMLLKGSGDMNIQSQNKLLKTLEEPPESVTIILCAERAETLMPTVRSRVKVYSLPPFTNEQIGEILISEGFTDAAPAAELSLGNADLALFYASEKGKELREYALEVIVRLKDKGGIAYFGREGAVYAKESKQLFGAFSLMFSNIFKLKNSIDGLVKLKSVEKELYNASNQFTNSAIIEIIDTVNEICKNLTYNANFSFSLDRLLFKIQEVKNAPDSGNKI